MARIKARLGALAGTLALAAGVTLTNAGPAAAAPVFTFTYERGYAPGDYIISVYNNGKLAGLANWFADPSIYSPGGTGDTLEAWDGLADGYGIEAHLNGTYRIASTAGHNSPYSDVVTGNIAEGTALTLRAWVVKGGDIAHSDAVTVYA